ncbi:hypothetical protein [Leptospira alexanderi]|uniref:Uncharacterized protein n=1 Tax=Leptospira alexanderi serovar Manhao 3 str. L 60 TaxID=1049759 RepID=V6I1F0_9LEPT|nr:hypothetical protein [Leptospira alexanderi]EQA63187.1 hypothetical protein LEP1GSC062_3628 [Leptospira alexanderi serovar Manhao 3 str. L 60]
MKQIISILVLICMFGCVSLPETLKKKASSDLSILAVSISLQAPIALFSKDASDVLFVKLANPKDKKSVAKVIPSNFAADSYVYLVNAEPGTYTVILAGAEKQNQNDTPVVHYLNNETIEKIKINVNKNELVYGGKFVLNSSQEDAAWGKVDKANRDQKLISSNDTDFSRALLYASWLDKVESNDVGKQNFLEKAKKVFAESEWASIVK